ncbi:MAG: alginate export family protein [Planctomycetes bacterium]|nr:alginate export family protein [Planctomycetota bacterium]
MRTAQVLFAGIVASLVTHADARAQDRTPDSLFQQQRLIDQKLADERSRRAPIDSLVDFQYGGWFDYYVFHFDDGSQQSRLFQRPGLAVWTRLRLDQGAHEFFARMRLTYNYFKRGDEIDRQQDWVGPNFDRAWYQVDVGRALRLTDPSDPFQFQVRIGRQEVQFGNGYVLDMPLDAVRFDARLRDFRLTGLFAKTIASTPNVDRSPPVQGHSERNFFGVQLTYEGLGDHEPFAYALWNQDHTRERPSAFLQEFDYDSQYFGVGSRGTFARNLHYWTEWVYETGHSFGDGAYIRRDVVDAWAWDVGLEYLFDHEMHPRLAFEYMFASGDRDRQFSPTSAMGGNRNDRSDTSFVGFGFRDTGLSAAPVLSNIHVWRVGASFMPLRRVELFEHFELGTNWFLYYKNRRGAAISDPTADRFSGYVGWEIDTFLNWRLSSDLSWTTRWGVFFPGKAYSDRDTRHFLLSGLTWSF